MTDFLEAGERVGEIEVTIGPQFLNLFSEHLYSSPNKAFEELVSNSWDESAKQVRIRVPTDLQGDQAAIWVLDDGESMDLDGFRALWAVATSNKREHETSASRKQIGKFGVGKLATYLLAHELTYVCRAADGVTRAVTMDYQRIDKLGHEALHIDPLPLEVHSLDDAQILDLLTALPDGDEALEHITADFPGPESDPEFIDEFGGESLPSANTAGTWTLAILSSLKQPGRQLQVGRIRRLLRTALPLAAR